MKAGETLMIIALLLTSLSLIVDVSIGKASVTVQFFNSVSASASAAMSHGDWSQAYGGSGDDFAYSLVKTSDGGYALAGYASSSGAGYCDFYLVKTDSAANMQARPRAQCVKGYLQ